MIVYHDTAVCGVVEDLLGGPGEREDTALHHGQAGQVELEAVG